MELPIIYLVLAIIGACLGSFACATFWRLRAKQLYFDKRVGDSVNAKEYKRLEPLMKLKPASDRSRCLGCGYVLKWYDMIPLFSWLVLGGKCRKCHKNIGHLEILLELGLAVFFVASYIYWPFELSNTLEYARFMIWLASGVGLAILFVYDLKWSLLPDEINLSVIGLGVVNALIVLLQAGFSMVTLVSIIGAAIILSGFYLLIYLASRGRWIGFGDIKLGFGLALLLCDWRLAFLALFLANFIGCLIVIPPLVIGKLKRDSHIPFGPLFIAGFVFAMLFGNYILGSLFYVLI